MSNLSFLNLKRDKYMREMEKEAAERYIPIIKPEVGQFLDVLIKIKRPERILEIGTAIGYSAIWMARAAVSCSKKEVELVTIELDEERAEEAGRNFKHYGLENIINLKIGDAVEIIPFLRREFDFIFIDAAKGQYPYYLDAVMELIPPGGIIVADNVLYRGYVQKKGQVKHKRRSMVNNLKEYLELVTAHELLDTSVIPLADGLALSVMKDKQSCLKGGSKE